MTNKLRAQKLLEHLEYSAEQIASILAKFKDRNRRYEKKQDDEENNSADENEFAEEIRCEAQLLSEVLRRMDNPSEADLKPAVNPKSLPAKGEDWEQLSSKPGLPEIQVPPGCSINVRLPTNASPSVQGFLPSGELYKGHGSHSRSFNPDDSAGSQGGKRLKPGRATLSKSAATAQVVTWLWEWWDSDPKRSQKKVRR